MDIYHGEIYFRTNVDYVFDPEGYPKQGETLAPASTMAAASHSSKKHAREEVIRADRFRRELKFITRPTKWPRREIDKNSIQYLQWVFTVPTTTRNLFIPLRKVSLETATLCSNRHGPGNAEIDRLFHKDSWPPTNKRPRERGEERNGASRRGTTGSQTSPFLDFSLAR